MIASHAFIMRVAHIMPEYYRLVAYVILKSLGVFDVSVSDAMFTVPSTLPCSTSIWRFSLLYIDYV